MCVVQLVWQKFWNVAHTRIAKQGKVFENVLIMNVAFWIICGNQLTHTHNKVQNENQSNKANEQQ